jgi:hypothetical protein
MTSMCGSVVVVDRFNYPLTYSLFFFAIYIHSIYITWIDLHTSLALIEAICFLFLYLYLLVSQKQHSYHY